MPPVGGEDPLLGSTLDGRYRIDAVLGRGGMGVVYRGRDLRLDRDVAIKLVPAHELNQESCRRLVREARAAAALSHPRIVAIYDTGEFGGEPFIVMELVRGTTLRDAGPLGLREALDVGLQLCDALSHAHGHGIVHRDLKPENVMITREGRRLSVKLADLGLAMASGTTRLSHSSLVVGTVWYLAPEQALGGDIDGRADLYSLGVLLYEMTVGRLPFNSDNPMAVISQHLHAPVVPPRTYRPDLPADLEKTILRLMAKRPDLRYASAAEVAGELEHIAQDPKFEELRARADRSPQRGHEAGSGSGIARQGGRWLRDSRWLRRVTALAAALAVLLAGGYGIIALAESPGCSPRVDLRDQTAAGTRRRLHDQARKSVEDGIKAYEHGDLDYARSHLQFAGELLMLSDLAPRGTSLLQPAELFRGIMGELPSRLRTFDFARALEASPAAQHHASLQGLSNSEYIGHEVRRIAIELGQDENVPSGFVEKVELFVRQDAGDPAFQGVIDRSASTQGRLRGLFAEAHLPELFCYIPWVESELVPTATSRDGARGLWQFSEMTGRLYGLRIDTRAGIDERINVVESTRAATRYIGYLFRKFGREQFMCALASYNRGDAAVFAALSKIPDPMLPSSLRYWYLVEHDLLPAETREYVPRVFATRILAENPERFGLKRP